MSKDKIINVDVMIGEYYYLSFKYRYCPLFILNMNELCKYAEEKFPSLKNKDYKLEF